MVLKRARCGIKAGGRGLCGGGIGSRRRRDLMRVLRAEVGMEAELVRVVLHSVPDDGVRFGCLVRDRDAGGEV